MARVRTATVLIALTLLSACGGGDSSVLRDAVATERSADGTPVDGVVDDWRPPQWDEGEPMRLASPSTALVLVFGVFGFGEGQTVERIAPLGACDAPCLDLATAEIDRLTADEELPRIYDGYCGNCAASYVGAVEVVEGDAVPVERARALELSAPIDTDFEVELAVGDVDLLRNTDDGWEYITWTKPECLPADITYTRSALSPDGAREERESYVEPADPDGKEVCD